MAGVTKLRPVKSPEGSLRDALAAAIKAAKAAHTAVAKQKQAKTRLFEQQIEAEAAVAPAEKAVAEAQERFIDAVAEAAVLEKPTPVGTVAEAMASLAFKRDRVNVLRSARKTVEAELPEWQADAVAADVEVERLISQIIADYVQVLVSEASELARRLGPYRAALMEFVKEHGDSPRAWDAQDSFRKSRAPLNETADQAWAFFRELRECDAAPINPWRSARERLRENPNASLLRELVAEHAGLLADPDDPRPQPA